MTVKNSWIQPEIRRLLAANGLFGIGQVHHAVAVGGNSQPFFEGKVPSGNLHYGLADAITNIESGRNDVIVVSPDSHSQSAALTFTKSNSHLLGMAPPGMMNHRSRIGHSDNFATMFTMSGSGNSMHNIYFMHGRGGATNKTLMSLTGSRNSFFNCHFGGPMNATEADEADYTIAHLVGAQECYFKHCTFGVDTIARGAANTHLKLGANTSRNIFEDCLFVSMSDASTPYFINVLNTLTFGWTIFKRCLFLNYSSNWASDLTVGCAIACTDTQHKLIFDSACNFIGVTDVVAANREGSAIVASVPYSAAATQNLLNVTADHTA